MSAAQPALNLHACMGESCYCRPGNEHLWRWTDEDKARPREAMQKLSDRERAMKDRDGI